jgi:hypothetical protein
MILHIKTVTNNREDSSMMDVIEPCRKDFRSSDFDDL